MRRAARIDENQKEIVRQLRKIPGMSVQPGHDDILVGFRGKTFWFEIKSGRAVSKRTGEVREDAIKPSQRELVARWQGHYRIVTTLDEILEDVLHVSLS